MKLLLLLIVSAQAFHLRKNECLTCQRIVTHMADNHLLYTNQNLDKCKGCDEYPCAHPSNCMDCRPCPPPAECIICEPPETHGIFDGVYDRWDSFKQWISEYNN